MKKEDVIELYNYVKKKRIKENKTNLFTTTKKTTGCKSCGRVTWKPNR